MTYTITDARHRFALWAACRAAQAGSAKAKRRQLMPAIEHCGVVQLLQSWTDHAITETEFDEVFDGWVQNVISFVVNERRRDFPFGIGAKLVSVYLKVAFVLGGQENSYLAQVIHPPIDSYLLKGIDKDLGTTLSKKYRWQKLTRQRYYELISELRRLNESNPFWALERFWSLGFD